MPDSQPTSGRKGRSWNSSSTFLNQFRATIREWRVVAKVLISKDHPILAHIIPIRRCNLSCAYCNEYDDFSDPVPTDVLCGRLDQLAKLGTSVITISGGEPLMHPELEKVITRIRERGMIAGLITNGYLMSRDRIRSLNAAGLEHLQNRQCQTGRDFHEKSKGVG